MSNHHQGNYHHYCNTFIQKYWTGTTKIKSILRTLEKQRFFLRSETLLFAWFCQLLHIQQFFVPCLLIFVIIHWCHHCHLGVNHGRHPSVSQISPCHFFSLWSSKLNLPKDSHHLSQPLAPIFIELILIKHASGSRFWKFTWFLFHGCHVMGQLSIFSTNVQLLHSNIQVLKV